jgi:hypothetical protein
MFIRIPDPGGQKSLDLDLESGSATLFFPNPHQRCRWRRCGPARQLLQLRLHPLLLLPQLQLLLLPQLQPLCRHPRQGAALRGGYLRRDALHQHCLPSGKLQRQPLLLVHAGWPVHTPRQPHGPIHTVCDRYGQGMVRTQHLGSLVQIKKNTGTFKSVFSILKHQQLKGIVTKISWVGK